MKKKSAMLIIIILVSLVFHSCLDYSLPNQLELEVEGTIDLPVKTATGNWGDILAKSLKKAFSGSMENGIGIEIYNVNYGQAVQSFCVYVPIEISDSLNPNDHLDIADLTKMDGKLALEIDEAVEAPSFENFMFICPVTIPLPIPPGVTTDTISVDIEIPVSSGGINLSDYISADFLHALIEEGSFTVALDLSEGNVILAENEFTTTYAIGISQTADVSSPGSPYDGLTYPPAPSTDAVRPLNGQDINGKPIEISGKVTLQPQPGGGNVTINDPAGGNELAGQLKITMNLTKFADIDWDFSKISTELEADPISLEVAAKYLNWIKFDKCDVDDAGEPAAGFGINVNFTEIIDGLEMSVGCNDLNFDESDKKLLQKGNNVFGNASPLEPLYLAGYKNGIEKLQFDIKLHPSGSVPGVLRIPNLEAGKPLRIKGEAKLFQRWTEAEVNMKAALKSASSEDGVFKGVYPDTAKDKKPIDLSLLDDYLEGFSFKDITASAYLSGPDQTIKAIQGIEPSLSIEARYGGKLLTVIQKNKQDPIILEKKHIVIAENAGYLDGKGAYKKNELPPDGNPFNFVNIINARPDDLVFHYNVNVPDEITVTPDMFVDDNNESVPHNIAAAIMLLIHMELAAGDEGGRIKFPDMFKDQNDLLGREPDKSDPSKPEKNSMFTSLDVGYLRLAVDFAGAFFTGGKFFIEKNNDIYKPKLFPQGIRIDGGRIAVNIYNEDFDKIKNNFINPDFWLEFESGGKITIPRNIGLTSVKIEAKGKTSVTLDF